MEGREIGVTSRQVASSDQFGIQLFYDAVMTVDEPQESPDPGDPLPPVPTPYSCRAYVEKYGAYYRANSPVEASDSKVGCVGVALLGDTMEVFGRARTA